jgi:hypothetical protein
MIMISDAESSRAIESEVDRAQRKEARRRRNPWAYVIGLLAAAAIVVWGFAFQDDAPAPERAFRASSNATSN